MNPDRSRAALIVFAALLLLAAFAVSVPVTEICLGAAVTAALLLVPTGLGLVVLPNTTISRVGVAPAILVAHLFGTLLITLLLFEREFSGHGTLSQGAISIIFAVASAAGYILRWPSIRDGVSPRVAASVLVCGFPGFVVPLVIEYGLFQTYPNSDLFEFTHTMKGAMEFARFDRINPFTADSYLPILQTNWGLAIHNFGIGPAALFRVLPIYAFILSSLIAWIFASSLSEKQGVRLWIVSILSVMWGALVLSNGGFSSVAALLVFALLAAPLKSGWTKDIGPTILVLVTAVAFLLQWNIGPGEYAFILVAFSCLIIGWAKGGKNAGLAMAIVLSACAIPYHRSSLLFIPAAAAAAWLVFRPIQIHNSGLVRRLLAIAALVLPLVGFAQIAVVLAADKSLDPFRVLRLSKFLMFEIFGNNLGLDGRMGFGARVALFETARGISLTILLALTSMGLLLIALPKSPMSQSIRRSVDVDLALRVWVTAVVFFIGMLVGIPFVHRLVFLPAALLAGTFGLAAAAVWLQAISLGQRATLVAFGLSLIITPAVVLLNPIGLGRASLFLATVGPYVLVSGAILLVGFVAVALRPRAVAPVVVAALAIGALLNENIVVRNYFFPYHYGDSGTMSHSAPVDVQVSQAAISWPETTLLVSDPVTISNVAANTGLSGAFTFSNLGTMPPALAAKIIALLRQVRSGQFEPQQICNNIGSVLGGESMYQLLKKLKSQDRRPGAQTLRSLGYVPTVRPHFQVHSRTWQPPRRPQRYDAVVILSPRTIDVIHYPLQNPYDKPPTTLPSDLVKAAQAMPNAVLANSSVVALRFKCGL